MRNLVLDSQILNTLQNCGFKTNLTFIKNLRPILKPTYFDDGDLAHQILAVFYRGQIENLTYKHRREKAIEAGWQHYSKLDLKIDEAQVMISVMEQYFDHQEDKEDFKVITVEQPFSFILGEDEENGFRVIYVGVIDLVVETKNQELRPWDHKTGGNKKKPHQLSNQFKGYCYSLGVNLIDINKIAIIKDEDKFRRFTMTYPDELLERWRRNTMWWAAQLDFFLQTNTWPQNFTSCDKYGGCEFSPICESLSLESMEQIANTAYKIGDSWDVSKILADSKRILLTEVQ